MALVLFLAYRQESVAVVVGLVLLCLGFVGV